MTKDEYTTLQDIAIGKGWEARQRLAEYLQTVEVKEEKKGTRTDAQNRSYWLWLTQIADQCEKEGVTADLLFKHTAHIKVTKNVLHEAIKSLCKALWNIDSTTNLEKTGHLDEIQDHVASWVGKEGVEVPPFPHEEVTNTKLSQHENLKNENYPEYDPTIHKPTI